MPSWSCGHARSPLRGSPYVPCPACGQQLRRQRNHWAALVAAIVFTLLAVSAAAVSAKRGAASEVAP